MSWSPGITVAVVLVAAVLTTGAAHAQVATTPREILADPDRFDGQVVTIEGTMTNLKQRVTRDGDVYYKFDLSDGTQAIRICRQDKSQTRVRLARDLPHDRMEHSPTSATGTGCERAPWHSVQRTAWEALHKVGDGAPRAQ